jgi:Flp pilus assembly pilin Flp
MITLYLLKLWRDDRGQDFIEYALMAALLCATIGVVMPGFVFPEMSTIFSKVTSSMAAATSAS